jgi:CDGSH-type Zn-finger protein
MAICTCGKSLNAPTCDGSHTLTDKQFEERKIQLEQEDLALYRKQATDLSDGKSE